MDARAPQPQGYSAREQTVEHDPHHKHDEAPGHEAHDHGGHAEAPAPEHDPDSEVHPEHGQHAHEHARPSAVHLSVAQRQTLGIGTERLGIRRLGETLRAPGEVLLNAYATAQVTPRIEAQITARHARLGDWVEAGQPLVTLSSVDMAEAQGSLVVTEREWQRLHKLRERFVSESNYLEASVARQTAHSRALAYGMTQAQIDALLQATFERTDGTFELLAPRSGTVIRDAFILGEFVQPGRVLFEITDETVRWVEARMPPEQAARVSVGDRTRIGYRDFWLDGRVTQIHHLLDETTRTQAVRSEVPDPDHRLHPGVFVDVEIFIGEADEVLALPEAAVLRSPDGHWQVFVADATAGTYKPVEVELRRTTGGLAVIEGVTPGTEVVTRGAFFLQSELAKGGFDPHQH